MFHLALFLFLFLVARYRLCRYAAPASLWPCHTRRPPLFPVSPMTPSDPRIDAIQQHLEAVTNTLYKRKVVENDDHQLLIAWQNEDTKVDYLLHIMKLKFHSYQVAFAIQKYRDIETRYDARLSDIELRRLLADPMRCVRLMLGQEYGL
jgi:hypothetical protein